MAGRFLHGEIESLPLLEKELGKVFPVERPSEIWEICQRINDLEGDELLDQIHSFDCTIKERIKFYVSTVEVAVEDSRVTPGDLEQRRQSLGVNVAMSADESERQDEKDQCQEWWEQDTEEDDRIARTQEQKSLCDWISRHYNGTVGPPGFHLYFVRCMVSSHLLNIHFFLLIIAQRGWEEDAFEKIHKQLQQGFIHRSILRAVFRSQYPGGIYIQVQSMLPGHTYLAAYLRRIPGLIYSNTPKTVFAAPGAFSRQHEKQKRSPVPTWQRVDLEMPIHRLVEGAQFDSDSMAVELRPGESHPTAAREYNFRAGTHAIPRSGRYRGDHGIVVDDDFGLTDTSKNALMIFIPRVKYPGYSGTKRRPPKGSLAVDWRSPPSKGWRGFDYYSPSHFYCIERHCNNAHNCKHQENIRKRSVLYGSILRGGFALVTVPLSKLEVAFSISDSDRALFHEIDPDVLNDSRMPPLKSWSFLVGESVRFTTTTLKAALPWGQRNADLEGIPKDAEGVISKVNKLVCEVDFKQRGLGLRSVPYYNLLKVGFTIGQTVKVADGVSDLKELRLVEIVEGLSQAMEETLQLGGQEGSIASVYMHPLNGNSVDVWLQDYNVIIALHPNSVTDVSDNAPFTLNPFIRGPPRLVFDEFSGDLHTESRNAAPFSFRPQLAPMGIANAQHPDALWIQSDRTLKDLHSTHPNLAGRVSVDVIDVRHCIAEQSTLQSRKNRFGGGNNCVHPDEFFGRLDGVRRPGRIPWYGVKVYIVETTLAEAMSHRYGWVTGYVEDVVLTDGLCYHVLIRWAVIGIENPFNWCPYENVRRCDNRQQLHQFTPYTGKGPWCGLYVQCVAGNFKGKRGRILSARSNLHGQQENISGLSFEVEFEYGYIQNRNVVASIDFDHLRRVDNMRFIHVGHSRDTGDNSFFQFKVGYTPTYSNLELTSFNRPKVISAGTPTEQSSRATPALRQYLRPDIMAHPIPIAGDFWLLDHRLWEALGQREIYVANPSSNSDECISLDRLGSGSVVFRAHKQRKGGSKKAADFNPVDLTALSRNPLAYQIKDNETANGLYLICQGEHIGKFARRIRVLKSSDSRATWCLQIVSCTWSPRNLAHSETIVDGEIIRTKPDIFVVVHEIDATKVHANKMMCAIRERSIGCTNGYRMQNGVAVKDRT